MPKRKASNSGKFEFKGFENLEFTDQEKSAVGAWLDVVDGDAIDACTVLVEAEYKVGVSWDDWHGVYSITATCKLKGSMYNGYCFVLKHADVGKGLLVMRYVYDTLLSDELYSIGSNNNRFDW